MVEVSIIIVNWNTKDFLKGCLDSIYMHTKDVETEVIVVDNASSDGSVGMVRIKYPQVRLITNSQNLGFARANNQAIMKSAGEYLLLLNSDAVVLENTIYEMLRFMRQHSEAAACGSQLLNPDKTIQISCYNFPQLKFDFFDCTRLNKWLPFKVGSAMYRFGHNSIKVVDYVSGACFMLCKKAVEKVGLFDEEFFMYGEEADWCWRAKSKGWKIFFLPQARVIHYGRKSTERYGLDKMSKEKAKSHFRFYKKHYGRLNNYIFHSLLWFTTLSRLLIWDFTSFLFLNQNEKIMMRKRIYSTVLKTIQESDKI